MRYCLSNYYFQHTCHECFKSTYWDIILCFLILKSSYQFLQFHLLANYGLLVVKTPITWSNKCKSELEKLKHSQPWVSMHQLWPKTFTNFNEDVKNSYNWESLSSIISYLTERYHLISPIWLYIGLHRFFIFNK